MAQYTEFSYFDQFSTIEIDLTQYLMNVSPSSSYVYSFSNMQPVKININNLFSKSEIPTKYKTDVNAVIQYSISDNETPYMVSYKYYDKPDFWWLIYAFNDIVNPWKDWPMTNEQLNTSANLLFDEESLYSLSIYKQYLFEENEKKRKIIIPRNAYLPEIIWEYRNSVLNV